MKNKPLLKFNGLLFVVTRVHSVNFSWSLSLKTDPVQNHIQRVSLYIRSLKPKPECSFGHAEWGTQPTTFFFQILWNLQHTKNSPEICPIECQHANSKLGLIDTNCFALKLEHTRTHTRPQHLHHLQTSRGGSRAQRPRPSDLTPAHNSPMYLHLFFWDDAMESKVDIIEVLVSSSGPHAATIPGFLWPPEGCCRKDILGVSGGATKNQTVSMGLFVVFVHVRFCSSCSHPPPPWHQGDPPPCHSLAFDFQVVTWLVRIATSTKFICTVQSIEKILRTPEVFLLWTRQLTLCCWPVWWCFISHSQCTQVGVVLLYVSGTKYGKVLQCYSVVSWTNVRVCVCV